MPTMPGIPEMGKVWGDWGNALTFIFDGSKTPEVAYQEAAANIRAAIATQTAGMVNVPGSWQKAAGFDCEWKPDCAETALTLVDGKYVGTFTVPAGVAMKSKLPSTAAGTPTTVLTALLVVITTSQRRS